MNKLFFSNILFVMLAMYAWILCSLYSGESENNANSAQLVLELWISLAKSGIMKRDINV